MILEEFAEERKSISITERRTVSEEALVTVNV